MRYKNLAFMVIKEYFFIITYFKHTNY